VRLQGTTFKMTSELKVKSYEARCKEAGKETLKEGHRQGGSGKDILRKKVKPILPDNRLTPGSCQANRQGPTGGTVYLDDTKKALKSYPHPNP
jgi:hypothetical protein